MIEEKVCRTKVKGGVLDGICIAKIKKLLEIHSFVNRLSVLMKSCDQVKFNEWISTNIQFRKILLECTLLEILNWVLSLNPSDRDQISLVSTDKNILHDNSVCIAHGKLVLKLNSETYLKSGFSFKKSNESIGNKKIHSSMFIHEFDLATLEENIKKGSRNDARLIWFSSNINKDVFRFALSIEEDDPANILEKYKGLVIKNERVIPRNDILVNCKCPDLTITKNEDVLAEQLEWCTYASILGTQLTASVDPYISRYNSMIDVASIQDINVFAIDGLLLSSRTVAKIYTYLIDNCEWFTLFSHGVKNITKSYNTKGEHTIVDDGTNDIVVHVNDGNYVLWEITDSGDPH
ncbi:hypothetical protein CANINC_002769 [Pichia inconspicua]|uniref:Uncharacterized protein n=1 Tax=Pichia inconspicua TaxID=52247 RepID=A0A4T0X1Y3_9ASCO|nr:hypothetical protein CANINC_002769 [[Candida] inconspicua]